MHFSSSATARNNSQNCLLEIFQNDVFWQPGTNIEKSNVRNLVNKVAKIQLKRALRIKIGVEKLTLYGLSLVFGWYVPMPAIIFYILRQFSIKYKMLRTINRLIRIVAHYDLGLQYSFWSFTLRENLLIECQV